MTIPDPNIIRKRELTIRGATKTREAIKIIITQETRGEAGELLQPTIELLGKFDTVIESARFARDMGEAFIIAAHYFEEWSHYVTGKR